MNYKSKLASMCQDYENQLLRLGDDFRIKKIVPICDKHGLSFFSGMGTFFFTDFEHEDIYDDILHAKQFRKYGLKSIFETLNFEISYNNYFGFYVADYKSK